ncbi:T/G mismatch-specific endonuclease [Desulfotomaculum arcticum]|uniref:Very short patch repair endonuclease n=1 Tax=Desulfotruncus arcticus DSM 17038 TaxID=1121424 RepID=A0A1I2ZNS0_9FIRM|nr:very short patch repair endonuclease [Desulfotruncus arcticus]SFH39340.1 T/G mismatch-specific endonuclease [Desulfotomaculum arcticum] [Desulfotruncus arcticus DSM 17038]
MADKYPKETRRKMMQSVKSKGTKIEDKISHDLWKQGIRFRRNVKNLFGKPDIAIKKYKIAIFIDSCFWHGCKEHCRVPKSNIEFWESKFKRNALRDKNVTEYYQLNNWNLLRIWEHELKEDYWGTLNTIIKFIKDCQER